MSLSFPPTDCSYVGTLVQTKPEFFDIANLTSKVPLYNFTTFDGIKFFASRGSPEAYNLFLEEYAKDLLRGSKYYFIEQNTTRHVSSIERGEKFEPDPIVRFFLEFDIQHGGGSKQTFPDPPSECCFFTEQSWLEQGDTPWDKLRDNPQEQRRFINVVLGLIFGVIAQCFCQSGSEVSEQVRKALWCIVCTHFGEQKSEKWQCGVHLHFPDLYLRLSTFAFLREYIIRALNAHIPPGAKQTPWCNIVDKAPHDRGCGLRLVGSYKAEKCSKCAKLGFCTFCMNHRFLHKERRYLPDYAVRTPLGSDPRTVPKSEEEAISYTEIFEEYHPKKGFDSNPNRRALFIRLIKQCSTKMGIFDPIGIGMNTLTKDNEHLVMTERPQGFVGDSRYDLLMRSVKSVDPNKMDQKRRSTKANATFVAMPMSVEKQSMCSKLAPLEGDALEAVRELFENLHKIYECEAWEALRPVHVDYYVDLNPKRTFAASQERKSKALSNRRYGDRKVFVLVKCGNTSSSNRYCKNKGDYHSANQIYFEIYPEESTPILKRGRCGYSLTTMVYYMAQRCYSKKKPTDSLPRCSTMRVVKTYAEDYGKRIFPPALDLGADISMEGGGSSKEPYNFAPVLSAGASVTGSISSRNSSLETGSSVRTQPIQTPQVPVDWTMATQIRSNKRKRETRQGTDQSTITEGGAHKDIEGVDPSPGLSKSTVDPFHHEGETSKRSRGLDPSTNASMKGSRSKVSTLGGLKESGTSSWVKSLGARGEDLQKKRIYMFVHDKTWD